MSEASGRKALKDALHYAWEIDRSMLVRNTIAYALRALSPFIAIWLSAYVVEQLTLGTLLAQMLPVVLAGVGVAFLIALIAPVLEKRGHVYGFADYMRWNHLRNEKATELDYAQLEDPAVVQQRNGVQRDQNWGSGISNTYHFFANCVAEVVRLICSVVLLWPIFSGSAFFRTPMTLVFVIAVVLLEMGVLLYNFRVRTKAELGFQKIFGSPENASITSKYGFFLWGFGYKSGKDARIYNIEGLIEKYVRGPAVFRFFRENVRRVTSATAMSDGLSGAVEALVMGGAYLFVALLSLLGDIGIGGVVRAAAGLHQLAAGGVALIDQMSSFIIDTKRLQSQIEYMALPSQMYKGTLPVEKRRDNAYEIEFRDVSFRYPGSEQWALRNLNLRLHVGTRMAVVGQNGSGKTTMIKLLCRLYDPTEGEITLNGIDIRKYSQAEYWRIFSVVFQDFHLFSISLGHNVAAVDDYDAAQVREALAMTGFDERAASMPQGLDTLLYKDYDASGVEVSGGEAQKIALARALYKNAPFIVLDEPTAALDPIAEFDIYARFNEIVGERTAIYISHRLSSCRFCQDILVFDEGRLIQRGSHEGLLAEAEGKYAALWHAQAQYYQEERPGGA